MRVIHILGASNSIGANSFAWILKDLLRDDLNWSVSIHSLAASGTSGALFGLSRPNSIGPGDYVLIDHEINDSGLIDSSIRDPAEINAIIASCVAICQKIGALPLLLVLPTVRASKGSSPGELVAEALSVATNLPIINLAKIFRLSMASEEIPKHLRDPYHPNPLLSQCIAELIRDALLELNPSYDEVMEGISQLEEAAWAGAVEQGLGVQVIERTSSARGASYGLLQEGQVVTFQVPYGYCLLAIVINSAVSGGIVQISNGYESFCKNLIFDWQLPNEVKHIAIAVDVKRRIHAFDKGLSIALIAQSDMPDCEKSLHQKDKSIELSAVEIEGIVCLDYMRLRPPKRLRDDRFFDEVLSRLSQALVEKVVLTTGVKT